MGWFPHPPTSLHRKTDDRNNMTMEQRTIIILWPSDRWQMHDDANSCRCHYVLIIHFLCFTLSLTNCCLKTRVTVHTDTVHFLNQWQKQRLESWGQSAWYNYRVVVWGGGGGSNLLTTEFRTLATTRATHVTMTSVWYKVTLMIYLRQKTNY